MTDLSALTDDDRQWGWLVDSLTRDTESVRKTRSPGEHAFSYLLLVLADGVSMSAAHKISPTMIQREANADLFELYAKLCMATAQMLRGGISTTSIAAVADQMYADFRLKREFPS